MQLKNYMEDLVMNQLDAVISSNPDVCGCEKCRHDIAAMALTILPARYVVTPKGETYTKIQAMELQFTVNIISAIMEGIVVVKSHPHHEKIGE